MLDVAAVLDPPLICSFNFFLLNVLIWFPRKYPKTFDAFRELKENMEKKRIKLTLFHCHCYSAIDNILSS